MSIKAGIGVEWGNGNLKGFQCFWKTAFKPEPFYSTVQGDKSTTTFASVKYILL